ncbi:MAG: FapA family protein, partial [Candidatus Cloacimonetes bacterium]|nr:FapA family protein [Candidatus Cloacimonadota bacterium]
TDTFTNPSRSLILEIRDEGLSAWMTICKTGKLVDEQEILELIDEAGIKYGLEEAVRWMEDNDFKKDFAVPFPVALCKTPSRETKLSYHFEIGRVLPDPRQISLEYLKDISYVDEGFVLAEFSYNLFDGNSSIYNVFGEMIALPDEHTGNLAHKAGTNTHYEEETHRYIALKSGYPYLDNDGKICVLGSIASCELSAGTVLRTPLSLNLKGNLEGCTIISKGDVAVLGNVLHSEIFCEGNLIIQGNIESSSDPGIHCRGDLSCNSIRDSSVLIKGKLILGAHVENSNLIAEQGIEGDPEQSWALSGNIQTCGSISLASVGTRDDNQIELEITISPYYKSLLMKKTRELIALKQDSEQNADAIDELNLEIRDLESKLDLSLEAFLKRERDYRFQIRVFREVYPKSFFRILKHSYPIKRYQPGIELSEED